MAINKPKLYLNILICLCLTVLAFLVSKTFTAHAASLVISPSTAASCDDMFITDSFTYPNFTNGGIVDLSDNSPTGDEGGGDITPPLDSVCGDQIANGILDANPELAGSYSLLELSGFVTECDFSEPLDFDYAACKLSGVFLGEAFFTIGVSGGMFAIPSGVSTELLANLGSQIADPGMLSILGIVAGIILAFYVMEKIIELFKPYEEVRIEDAMKKTGEGRFFSGGFENDPLLDQDDKNYYRDRLNKKLDRLDS